MTTRSLWLALLVCACGSSEVAPSGLLPDGGSDAMTLTPAKDDASVSEADGSLPNASDASLRDSPGVETDVAVEASPDVAVTTGVTITHSNVTTSSASVTWSASSQSTQLLYASLGIFHGAAPPGPDCWMNNPAYSLVESASSLPVSGGHTFQGLQPNTVYSVLVCVSQNAVGVNPLRAVTSFTTGSLPTDGSVEVTAPPPPPTFVTCSNLDNGITVRWASSSPGFWVVQRLQGFEPTSCTDFGSVFVTSRQWDVNGSLGKTYVVWVCASDTGGLSTPLKVMATEPFTVGQNGFCTPL